MRLPSWSVTTFSHAGTRLVTTALVATACARLFVQASESRFAFVRLSSCARVMMTSEMKSGLVSSARRFAEYSCPSNNVTTTMPLLISARKRGRTSITASRLRRSRLSTSKNDPFATLPLSTSAMKRDKAPSVRFWPRYALTPRSLRLSSSSTPRFSAHSRAFFSWRLRLSPRSCSGREKRMYE